MRPVVGRSDFKIAPLWIGLATFAAMLASVGCARPYAAADPISSGSPRPREVPACPNGARPDGWGRCACSEGLLPLLGGCIQGSVADAFCGGVGRSGQSGCTFPSCEGGELFDNSTGRCVRKETLQGPPAPCAAGTTAVVDDDHILCAPLDAACPRGTVDRAHFCVRELRCPPGSLPEETVCRPFVFAAERGAETNVDVGAFLAFAVGIDGGLGSPALCRPLIMHPSLFEGTDRRHALHISIRVIVPDQDLTGLRVDVSTRAEPHPSPSAVPAESAVANAVRTLIEPLRGLGKNSMSAAAHAEVECDLQPSENIERQTKPKKEASPKGKMNQESP